MIIIQILLLIFECWVFLPLFGAYGVNEAVRMVLLSPFAIGVLVLNLIITILKIIKSVVFRRKIYLIFELIILMLNVILGVVFIF